MTKQQLQRLDALRAKLDRIDDEILHLIEQRLAASADIAAAVTSPARRLWPL